jgi:tight adherence protein C
MQLTSIEEGQFVLYAGYALVAIGGYLIGRMLDKEREALAAQENLAELRNRDASNVLVKIGRPFFTAYVMPLVRGRPLFENQRRIYKRRLITAGLRDELTADEFISFKLFNIIMFPILLLVMNALGDFGLGWTLIIGSGPVGWFYPDLWVNSRIKTRQKLVLNQMPFVVDLLALSTEAGLDFVGAIGKVVEKAKPSPLVEELSQLLKEIKVGSSRSEAMREMALRLGMSEINSFVAILVSADQMGASIGKILRQQSEQIRVDRILRAEKAGAAAQQKIILPIVLFIVPAVMIMIFAPMGISVYYSGGGF